MQNTFKKISVPIVGILVITLWYLTTTIDTVVPPSETITDTSTPKPQYVYPDIKNSGYIIGTKSVLLTKGIFEEPFVSGSSSVYSVKLFGEPVYGDLNDDGEQDAAILLVVDDGTLHYYAALAIATGTGFITTNTLLLGENVAPQTVEIHDERALYNYAERKANEPLNVPPSIGKSLWIYHDQMSNTIGELVKDFEGEANPSTMSVHMNKWQLVKIVDTAGHESLPLKNDAFTLLFNNDKTVTITTDCNNMSGKYVITNTTLIFESFSSTKMYCEGSQEQLFSKNLSNTSHYSFTSKGELVLKTKDSTSIIFR